MPRTLRREVMIDINMRTMRCAPVFLGCDKAMVALVCSLLSRAHFLKDEVSPCGARWRYTYTARHFPALLLRCVDKDVLHCTTCYTQRSPPIHAVQLITKQGDVVRELLILEHGTIQQIIEPPEEDSSDDQDDVSIGDPDDLSIADGGAKGGGGASVNDGGASFVSATSVAASSEMDASNHTTSDLDTASFANTNIDKDPSNN